MPRDLTTTPRYEVAATPLALFEAAAERLVEVADAAITARGEMLLALSGGSTPRGLFQLLATPAYRDRAQWDRVHFFWGDERTVAPDHPDSNYAMAYATLLHPLRVAQEHVHRIRGEHADPAAAAHEYMQTIATVAGWQGGAPPHFDLILLGLGDDAHTASLFPGTEALAADRAWVVANPVPQHGTTRITMTFPLINAARQIFFLACGADKQEAVANVHRARQAGAPDDAAPASRVQPSAGVVTWFLDEEAASEMGSPEVGQTEEHTAE